MKKHTKRQQRSARMNLHQRIILIAHLDRWLVTHLYVSMFLLHLTREIDLCCWIHLCSTRCCTDRLTMARWICCFMSGNDITKTKQTTDMSQIQIWNSTIEEEGEERCGAVVDSIRFDCSCEQF